MEKIKVLSESSIELDGVVYYTEKEFMYRFDVTKRMLEYNKDNRFGMVKFFGVRFYTNNK